jgi:hypothetical protein
MKRVIASASAAILKLLPVFGLLFLVGAAFAVPGTVSSKAGPQIIDTGEPVEMSQCTACHADFNTVSNPNLVNFTHSTHFKRDIDCQVCHTVFPHQPGGTVKPTMELCANCHRLQHGNQGPMAAGQCDFCHPADFKLTPKDHDKAGFAAKDHAAKAKENTQSCLVCHQSDTCESCHADSGIPPAPAQTYRWFGLWPVIEAKGQKITIGDNKVTMAACQACHLELRNWKNEQLVNFKHSVHFEQDVACDRCHDSWPHSTQGTKKPEMAACVSCHRLDHGKQGRLVSAESAAPSTDYCFLCHPREMNLKPGGHTAEFAGGDHKRFAKEDRGLCRGCHIQAFCDSCHQIEIPHAQGWRSEHGKVAAAEVEQADGFSCFRCHKPEGPQQAYESSPSCDKCHKAVVYPHEDPWAPKHGVSARAEGKGSCETCHVKQAFCDKCHGGIKMPHPTKWLGEHRQFLEENPIESCDSCHSRAQCEQCHTVHKLHNRHTLYNWGAP